ncbi:hypothetical protein LINGRAPRIM_LOCUS2804 [Linum grandiflorum]
MDMTSFVSSSHRSYWSVGGRGVRQQIPEIRRRLRSCSKLQFSTRDHHHYHRAQFTATKRCRTVFATVVGTGGDDDDDPEDDDTNSIRQGKTLQWLSLQGGSDAVRDNLERIVGRDDSTFSGIDLATLIRNKYGRSYDVQLIKKEFMGKNFLAMNVMWKYREQRSFPLTEEEYLLRLDDVANTLKCWGAVSHIRESLDKLKERPRIGKAVSIFIDMDEKGGRANEWIYK